MHTNNADICDIGCTALWNISEGTHSIQKEICEKGGLNTFFYILEVHKDNLRLLEACSGVIGVTLSNQDLYLRFVTQDILYAVEGCHDTYKGSKEIEQFFLGLTRKEDKRVRDAVERGYCTKIAFPKCSYDCMCDENAYCSRCCVQQKVFRCFTCDKDELKFYCETCWNKDHQDHECEEFFYPARCSTM